MATTIEKYLEAAARRGITNTKSQEAIDWFRNSVRKTAVTPKRIKAEESANLIPTWRQTRPGNMYLVHYDPKHKETLPYYDIFPLIIPIDYDNKGMLGLNLHYLPPILRAKLLDALMGTDLEVSYGILKKASKYKHFEHCLKRYLGDHFRGRFIQIKEEAWPIAAMLPVEQFEKSSRNKVWQEIRGRR